MLLLRFTNESPFKAIIQMNYQMRGYEGDSQKRWSPIVDSDPKIKKAMQLMRYSKARPHMYFPQQ